MIRILEVSVIITSVSLFTILVRGINGLLYGCILMILSIALNRCCSKGFYPAGSSLSWFGCWTALFLIFYDSYFWFFGCTYEEDLDFQIIISFFMLNIYYCFINYISFSKKIL